MLYIFTKLY